MSRFKPIAALLAVIVVTAITTGLLWSSHHAAADSSYKKSRWASKLERGVLKVQGPGYGPWASRWLDVASNVASYTEAGTSKGPVLIYLSNKQWHAVQLHFSSGQRQNPRSFSEPVRIVRPGQFGVIIQVGGKQCYDYSWQQLRPIKC